MTTTTSGVLARFPLLLPVRNSFASYGASAVTLPSQDMLSGYPCAAGDVLTSADWLHLRNAQRGHCTGCDARTSADWLHLRNALRCHCTGCDAWTSADWLHLRGSLRCARWLQLQAQAAPCF
jgi:hypothetical protein